MSHREGVKKPKGIEVTIRDIAAAVGCSHASVSRALRGEAKVSPELRKKVEKAAKEMGYRPNPLVASLMAAHNKRKARESLTANIAWINSHPNKNFWHVYQHNNRFFKAATERALELGFGFDELWAHEPGMTGERFDQILKTRGIHGLLITNVCKQLTEIGFDTSGYAVSAIGPIQEGQEDWHRASISYRMNMESAFDNLRARNYKRIAHTVPMRGCTREEMISFNKQEVGSDKAVDIPSCRAELAGFYFRQQYVPKEDRMAPYMYDRDDDDHFIDVLAEWIKKEKPDAIIHADRAILAAVEAAGISCPDDIGLAHLMLADDVADWAGMDTHPEYQAEAAVDLLSTSVQYNQRGVPKVPRNIHIQGEWKDGWTAPGR